MFISQYPNIIVEFNDLFAIFQRYYYSFTKIALLYKFKKAKLIISNDLYMNPIKENNKNIYTVFQNNNKYLFTISDLIKIIHNSLSNADNFFINPLPIKNPYNNIIFNNTTLYNIYLFVLFNTVFRPDLFFYFVKINLNVKLLVKKHKYLLRTYAIKNYLQNNVTILYKDILSMIYFYNNEFKHNNYKINIDLNFPQNTLVEIMKPYLHLYLIYNYSYIEIESLNCKLELLIKLHKFSKYNPCFGKQIYKIKKIQIPNSLQIIKQKCIEYNTRHLKFNR
jgi:hypothetical protein